MMQNETKFGGNARLGILVVAALAFASACSGDDDDAQAAGGTGGLSSGTGGTNSGGTGGTATGGGAGSGGMTNIGDVTEGKNIFRDDTFGDEQLWTDTLQLHTIIQQSISPETALSVGLKVDSDALPEGILDDADLSDPATTVALIELDAVVGVKGTVQDGELVSLGITCALCHSTVDDSVMPGIGKRLDGWNNSDLNPGAIIALSDAITAEQKAVLQSWGPGRYDPYWNQDRPLDESVPVLIPPIYGLQGMELETFTGEGPISYWNYYVAVTQMGGQGDFQNEELGIDIDVEDDLVTPKLPDLLAYQLSLEAPTPPADSFDAEAAERGEALFQGDAMCSTCHTGATLSDDTLLHDPSEVGTDPRYAQRGTTGKYRTTPLRGLFAHPPYFHDGSAETLEDVVDHYDTHLELGLSAEQKSDLVEYLKSL